MSESSRGAAEEARAFAWNWFALHSGQRMQLVNFWLVAVAFLGAAYVQAQAVGLRGVAVGVAVAGVTSSVSFWLLDERTRQLVRVAEDALAEIDAAERHPASAAGILARSAVRPRAVFSYRVIIRGLHLSMAILFAAGCVYALVA